MRLQWATESQSEDGEWVTEYSEVTEDIEDHGIYYRATDPAKWEETVGDLLHNAGYIESDVVLITPATPNLDQLLLKFQEEHRHTDDEIRLIIEGECYFEVRDARNGTNGWFRVEVLPGDLLIVPAGRWHRFGLGPSRRVKAARLFKVQGGWVAENRQLNLPF